MTAQGKAFVLRCIGMVFFIIPPVIATANYFPLISGQPRKQLSFAAVILILIACIPLWRFIKALLRSPSALKIWVILFVIFLACEAIAREVKCIALVGVIGSIIGDAFFLWAKKVLMKAKEEVEGDG